MAFIKIDNEGRVTAASYEYHCGEGELEVTIPQEIDELSKIHDYLYVDGEFIYSPAVVEVDNTPSQLDRIEA